MATGSAETDGVRRRIAVPGTVLGIGLGGFVDGILLHQILQWHHMLSSTDSDNIGVKYYPTDTVPGLRMNTLWDGFFHAFTWLAVLIGLGLLYSRVVHSRGRVWRSRMLWGWILVGWGCSTWWRASSTITSWASTTCAPARTRSGGTWDSCSWAPC